MDDWPLVLQRVRRARRIVLTDDDNGFSDVADAEQRLLNESRARPVAGDN